MFKSPEQEPQRVCDAALRLTIDTLITNEDGSGIKPATVKLFPPEQEQTFTEAPDMAVDTVSMNEQNISQPDTPMAGNDDQVNESSTSCALERLSSKYAHYCGPCVRWGRKCDLTPGERLVTTVKCSSCSRWGSRRSKCRPCTEDDIIVRKRRQDKIRTDRRQRRAAAVKEGQGEGDVSVPLFKWCR